MCACVCVCVECGCGCKNLKSFHKKCKCSWQAQLIACWGIRLCREITLFLSKWIWYSISAVYQIFKYSSSLATLMKWNKSALRILKALLTFREAGKLELTHSPSDLEVIANNNNNGTYTFSSDCDWDCDCASQMPRSTAKYYYIIYNFIRFFHSLDDVVVVSAWEPCCTVSCCVSLCVCVCDECKCLKDRTIPAAIKTGNNSSRSSSSKRNQKKRRNNKQTSNKNGTEYICICFVRLYNKYTDLCVSVCVAFPWASACIKRYSCAQKIITIIYGN